MNEANQASPSQSPPARTALEMAGEVLDWADCRTPEFPGSRLEETRQLAAMLAAWRAEIIEEVIGG
jgi:hypothetical protein